MLKIPHLDVLHVSVAAILGTVVSPLLVEAILAAILNFYFTYLNLAYYFDASHAF